MKSEFSLLPGVMIIMLIFFSNRAIFKENFFESSEDLEKLN